MVMPWECHDQEEYAEMVYNDPLRAKLKQLEAENLKLKQSLRLNGFSWTNGSVHRSEQAVSNGTLPGTGNESKQLVSTRQASSRRTRASIAEENRRSLPHLPVEVQLRVLYYAMTSPHPIIDPLSKTNVEHLVSKEKARGNQIAISFLATCKAYHVEGTSLLWENNTFTFTTVQALARFAELDLSVRRHIQHVNLRITARYYDDENRKHYLETSYHPAMKKRIGLKVIPRLKENDLSRKGFRSYSWNQVIDFLQELRPPFDPNHDKSTPRPRLLPNLASMRIDLVNFPEYFLPYPDNDLHESAAHQLGCTIDELIVTGIPRCEMGAKAIGDFCGMVKDDGLYVDGAPSFIYTKSGMKPLPPGNFLNVKAVRAWRTPIIKATRAKKATGNGTAQGAAYPGHTHSDSDSDDDHHAHSHRIGPRMAPAPEEHGHPKSIWKKRRTIWKRVPKSCDSVEREWVEFDRASGYPMLDVAEGESEDEDVLICEKCGDLHENDSYGADEFSHFDPFDIDAFGF